MNTPKDEAYKQEQARRRKMIRGTHALPEGEYKLIYHPYQKIQVIRTNLKPIQRRQARKLGLLPRPPSREGPSRTQTHRCESRAQNRVRTHLIRWERGALYFGR